MDRLTRDAALDTLQTHLEKIWPLFDNAANQEIMINQHNNVWVESGGTMARVEGCEIDRSVIPTQTYLNRFKADFLLHRGWFHRRLATTVRAFLSTG